MPRSGRLLALDLLIAVWVVAWIALGVRVGQEVRDVGRISRTVGRVGGAVEDTGRSLRRLSGLPLVGDRIADTAGPIRVAGANARQSAEQSRQSARELSWLLGGAIALVPTLPLLLVYVPGRLARARDRRAIERAWRRGGRQALEPVLLRVHLRRVGLEHLADEPQGSINPRRMA